MLNLIFVENYAKLNMSANYVNVKTGHGDIDENIKLNGPNEEGFLKNIEVTSVFVHRHIFIYLIRTNFRGHLISRIWNTNISRALIFAMLQKMTNLGHLISRKLTKDRLRKPGVFFLLIDHLNND